MKCFGIDISAFKLSLQICFATVHFNLLSQLANSQFQLKYLCFRLFNSWNTGWIIYSLKNHKNKSELSHIQALLDFSIMNFPLLLSNSKYTVGVSWPCLCLRGNNASQLNYSDRPALFTHKEDEEGMGEQSAELVVEEGSWRNNANKWGGSEGRQGGAKVKRPRWGHSGEKTSRGMTASRLQGCEARWLAGLVGGCVIAGRIQGWHDVCLTDWIFDQQPCPLIWWPAAWWADRVLDGQKGWLAASADG